MGGKGYFLFLLVLQGYIFGGNGPGRHRAGIFADDSATGPDAGR
jgi:hypothetical protein